MDGKVVIMGAGGHAKEVIDTVLQRWDSHNILFFDNGLGATSGRKLLNTFEIVDNLNGQDTLHSFYLGVGGLKVRRLLAKIATNHGLRHRGLRDHSASIGNYEINLAPTADLLAGVTISNGVSIGERTLINRRANIHHDVTIGEDCEIAPQATLLGRVVVGNEVFIGSRAVLLPGVVVGEGAIIGAGAVVIENVEPFTTVVGVPARRKL